MILGGGAKLQHWFDNITTLLDLEAQRDMAYWARWMLYATVGSIIVGVAGFFVLVVSLLQTREAIKNSRELGEAQARAYVHVKAIKCSGGAVIATVVNAGETPCPVYYVGCEALKVPLGEISKKLKPDVYRMKSWQALAARDETTVRVEITRGKGLLSENVYQSDAYNPEIVSPWDNLDRLVVVGVVKYEDVFGKMFQTYFAFYATSSQGKFLKPTHMLPAYMPDPNPYPIALTHEDEL